MFSILGGSPSRGGSPSWGVLHPGGVLHPRGWVSIPGEGVLHPGGFSIWGGSPSQGVGVLHPRGWGFSTPGGVGGGSPSWGALHPRGLSILGGVPCDISHHAFDVTCMLPPHQLRHINSAPAYILLPGHVTCKACWDTHPPCGQTHTCKNITFANYVCRR